MSRIAITSHSNAGVTLVPDLFIDAWMPQANGEFVKIYLYLLRCTHLPDQELSLSSLADVFSCTENDILRALRYWEKSGLLRLSAEGASLTGIEILPCGSQRQDLDEDFSKSSPVPVKKEETAGVPAPAFRRKGPPASGGQRGGPSAAVSGRTVSGPDFKLHRRQPDPLLL